MYQSFEGCVTNDVTAANLLSNASLCQKPDKYCSQNANLPTTYKITQLYNCACSLIEYFGLDENKNLIGREFYSVFDRKLFDLQPYFGFPAWRSFRLSRRDQYL